MIVVRGIVTRTAFVHFSRSSRHKINLVMQRLYSLLVYVQYAYQKIRSISLTSF